MNEEQVFFKSGSLNIEGLYCPGDGSRGAVITHPHSQMGGSMMNNVVDAMVAAFQGQGIATLRFNFRGVGRSEGVFDNGIGEQDDVEGALAFFTGRGVGDVILSGYSFGAWVNSRLAARKDDWSDFIMVSPPIDFVEFDLSVLTGKCGFIICGDRDQFCPITRLEGAIQGLGCRVVVVPGADHFYFGWEGLIQQYLNEYLSS